MSKACSKITRPVRSALAASAISFNAASFVCAHPGHGVTPEGDSLAHYIIEPTHGFSLAVMLVVAVAVAITIGNRASRSGKEPTV